MDMSPASLYDEDPTKHSRHVLQILWWPPAPATSCPQPSLASAAVPGVTYGTYSSGGHTAATGHHVPQRREKGLAATRKHVANVPRSPPTLLVNAKHIERWNGTPRLPKKKWVTKDARPPYVCNRKCLTRWQRICLLCKWFKNVGGAVEMRVKRRR